MFLPVGKQEGDLTTGVASSSRNSKEVQTINSTGFKKENTQFHLYLRILASTVCSQPQHSLCVFEMLPKWCLRYQINLYVMPTVCSISNIFKERKKEG